GSFTYDPTNSQTIQQLTAGGNDVVDTFSYGITDPFGATTDPDVSIVVKGGPSPYHYDIVTTTFNGQNKALGWGPSINHPGNVAHRATTQAGQDTLYIWGPAANPNAAVSTAAPGQPQNFSVLGDWATSHTLYNDPSQVPFGQYAPMVQLNDSN